MKTNPNGPVPNVEPVVPSMIIKPNGSGAIWIPVSTARFCTPLRRAASAASMERGGGKLPWAEPHSRFTALMEGLAIAGLKQASQKAVAEQLHLSWDEIHAIMERAVERGLARRKAEEIPYLGVDEKAFRKGH